MNADARKSLFTLALVAFVVCAMGVFGGAANPVIMGVLCIVFGIAAFKLMPSSDEVAELRREEAHRVATAKPRMNPWAKLLLVLLIGPPAALVLFFAGWALLAALGAKP